MGHIRRIMQDRSSAGAIATLAVLLFLLQGLANGLTSGNMAMAALAADEVICSSHMPEGPAKQDPAGKIAADCCGTLCRLASATIATLPVTPVERADRIVTTDEVAFLNFDAALPPSPPNLESRPRAPPTPPQN
ncbi:DUF2946 domain-containing protein [Agrobacterium genomosp. 3]|uniref:DUF2946 domain-containing protein n=1 Tax=Agrobacterium tumefaciens TaxID=358 RepID=A0AAE6BN34_AGRTU|nr:MULTISPECIES: DUF2946 family protein [Agrobacterium tumefaciens complex]MBP8937869.1 DUF2946 domain-containing protein [Agrobacterium sp.]MCA1867399.1 DUF2946 domain-containing protein [Agrobacterium tomkonis]MCA1877751.1 DUF2946 domain-containing protein [Agrobacterium tumefaciens]MCA1893040.1 DUF2946 domain-containing protein [Agrobacterium tomkonis]MCA2374775.1 DUF2946 domain-containing protein [Agrobacterium tomkonis CIP 111-78]